MLQGLQLLAFFDLRHVLPFVDFAEYFVHLGNSASLAVCLGLFVCGHAYNGEQVGHEHELDLLVERTGGLQGWQGIHLQQPRFEVTVHQQVEAEQFLAAVPLREITHH